MFVVTVTFHIKNGQIDDFMPLMIQNAQTSMREEGECSQFDVCRDEDEVFLYEVYESRAAFDLHLKSAHFLTFDAAVADMVETKSVRMFEEVHR